jgi:hypothetical protein
MIAGMNKLAFLSTAFLVGLCGCGGPSETAKPSATPASDVGAEVQAPQGAEPAKTETAQPATTKTDARPSEAGKSQAGQPGTALQANAPEKKGCAGLKKDLCKITLGCAWSTKGMCVDH